MFTPASIATELGIIATELETGLPALGPNIPPDVMTQITTGLDAFKQSVAAFAAADVNATPDMVMRIGMDANAVFGVLAGLSLPAPFAMTFRIAQMMVPVFVGLAGMFL